MLIIVTKVCIKEVNFAYFFFLLYPHFNPSINSYILCTSSLSKFFNVMSLFITNNCSLLSISSTNSYFFRHTIYLSYNKQSSIVLILYTSFLIVIKQNKIYFQKNLTFPLLLLFVQMSISLFLIFEHS